VRLKLVACEIAFREFSALAAESANIVDPEFLPKGLHDLETPDMVRRVQEAVDRADPKIHEAVALGYGLCNNGVVGVAAREIPIVIPRAHDCITFFLGSRARYSEFFAEHPGTYFRTTGWSERNFANVEGTIFERLGLNRTFEEYAAKYGEDNARYILEQMGLWQRNYTLLAFVDVGVAGHLAHEERARSEAAEKGWDFERVQGDLGLLRRLLGGTWDDDFLVVPPGYRIAATNDADIVRAEPAQTGRR
jgi:hypothetical protein